MLHRLALDLADSRAAIVGTPFLDADAVARTCAERLSAPERHQVVLDEVTSLAKDADLDEFDSVEEICDEHEGFITQLHGEDLTLALMYLVDCQDAIALLSPAAQHVFADAQTRLEESTTRSARGVTERLSRALTATIGELESAEHANEWAKSSVDRAINAHSALQDDIESFRERAERAGLDELDHYLMGLSVTNGLLVEDLERADAEGAQCLAEMLIDEIDSKEGRR